MDGAVQRRQVGNAPGAGHSWRGKELCTVGPYIEGDGRSSLHLPPVLLNLLFDGLLVLHLGIQQLLAARSALSACADHWCR